MPAINGTSTAGLDQPSRGCSISANTGPPSPAAHSARPGHVDRGAPAPRAGLAARDHQQDQRDAADHERDVDQEDPTPGGRSPAARRRPADPSTPAIAPHAVQLPIASPRSASGKVLTITASELGTSSAPATPCIARAATSTPIDGASAQASDADAEARNTEREYPPLAEQVPERPPDQDQRAERQQVAVDDPLLRRQAAAERALDRRQRDVHHRAVEQHDARAHDAGDQRQALRRGV